MLCSASGLAAGGERGLRDELKVPGGSCHSALPARKVQLGGRSDVGSLRCLSYVSKLPRRRGCLPGTRRCTPAAFPAQRCRRPHTHAAGAAARHPCAVPAVAGCSALCCNLCGKLCAARSAAIGEVRVGLTCRVSARSASTAHRGTGDDELLHLELLLPKGKWTQLAPHESALAPRFVRVPHVRQSYEWCAGC